MTNTESVFLEAYSLSLEGKTFTEQESPDTAVILQDMAAPGWRRLFSLADSHRVYPMIFEAVSPAQRNSGATALLFRSGMKKAQKLVLGQAKTSAEFLKLYQFLEKKGLSPMVIKGIICRDLYPSPELRSSSDEDLLIPPEEFDRYRSALLEYGLSEAGSADDVQSASEVSYYNGQVYIELHKQPFPPDSKAYGDLNRFFTDVEERKISKDIYGVQVYTMAPADHLFYQLCHAYKHFLNCGIGIRLVSDIVLFSIAYEKEIDWTRITENCREIRALDFAAALYKIGEKYLFRNRFPESLREIWLTKEIDEAPLLQDILSGGIYGTSSEDRLHSANITLGKMEAEKEGTLGSPIIRTLFPGISSMKNRYPVLRKLPFLLPAAWLHRIGGYLSQAVFHKRGGQNATEAVRIGNERVRLMKQYRMISSGEESWLKRLYTRSIGSVLSPVLSPVYQGISALEYAFLNLKWFLQGYRKPDAESAALVRENVTFILKSFERQKLVKGLVKNIQRMYPGTSIIIADDSSVPLTAESPGVRVLHLPFNSGLGAGLHAALAQVQTPFVMRMDDDELLTLKTMVHRELSYLSDHPELDLIGFGHTTAIRLHSTEFNFREYYKSPMDDAPLPLKIPHMTRLDDRHLILGKVANIYLARTDKLREVGFDPGIKVIDHHDFFWRAAGKITSAVALDTVVFHRHNPYDRRYNTYRTDYRNDLEYINKKRRRMLREVKNEI